jgi:hypothetical protein
MHYSSAQVKTNELVVGKECAREAKFNKTPPQKRANEFATDKQMRPEAMWA